MAKLVLDNGKEIELSKETSERLTKELAPQPEGFEKVIDGIRVSSSARTFNKAIHISYPVRISVYSMWGTREGYYSENEKINERFPGELLTKSKAFELIQAIQDCIDYASR